MTVTATASIHQARRRDRFPRRRMEFDYASVGKRFWFDDNGVLSALVSALSATFPPGEKQFVESVMHFRDRISDPVLLEQMKDFAAQEGQHAHQHRRANAWLDSLGFAATEVERDTERTIEALSTKRPPKVALASTVILEHITAILAEYMLTHESMLQRMPEPVRELLMWHAIEEIEHKAVAFDVFEAVSGDRTLLRRVAAVTTAFFLYQESRRTLMTLKALGHRPTPREMLETGRFLFGKQGIITSVLRPYRDFYRNDFHPWDHDNRALVEAWKATHEPAVHA